MHGNWDTTALIVWSKHKHTVPSQVILSKSMISVQPLAFSVIFGLPSLGT